MFFDKGESLGRQLYRTSWREWVHSGYALVFQTILNCAGYTLAIDEIYGPETRSRVLAFQGDHGLEATGLVDSNAWSKLRNELVLSSDNGRYISYSIGII